MHEFNKAGTFAIVAEFCLKVAGVQMKDCIVLLCRDCLIKSGPLKIVLA